MASTAPIKTGSSSKPRGSGVTPTSAGDLTPATVDLTGRQLGDYLLLRRLGQGGMAEVYLAEQISLCRRVAFKVLRSNLALDANYIRRFRVEAQTVASLVHPNIVQVYEAGCIEGVNYIAQEYVLGKNLKQVMQTEKALPIRTCVSIMRQVASALERAARSNIVHRDIKPENILITSGGEVKVADFGLARSEKSSSLELTQDNRAAALAFVKMQHRNLSIPRPGVLHKIWRATHPPLGERIDFCNEYRPWATGSESIYSSRFRETPKKIN